MQVLAWVKNTPRHATPKDRYNFFFLLLSQQITAETLAKGVDQTLDKSHSYANRAGLWTDIVRKSIGVTKKTDCAVVQDFCLQNRTQLIKHANNQRPQRKASPSRQGRYRFGSSALFWLSLQGIALREACFEKVFIELFFFPCCLVNLFFCNSIFYKQTVHD